MLTLLQVQYDLLVGADGAGSVVRSALQQIMPASYIRRYRHKQAYSMTQVTHSNSEDNIPPHAVFQGHAAKVGLTPNGSYLRLTGGQPVHCMMSHFATNSQPADMI